MIKKNPAKIPASISYLSLDHIKLDSIINSWLDCRPTAAVPLNLVSWIMPTTLGYFVFSQGIRCLCICKLLKHKNDISYFMVVVFIYYFWYYIYFMDYFFWCEIILTIIGYEKRENYVLGHSDEVLRRLFLNFYPPNFNCLCCFNVWPTAAMQIISLSRHPKYSHKSILLQYFQKWK